MRFNTVPQQIPSSRPPLCKANFFRNIGTITLFAVLGTVVSAVMIGIGLYVLGNYGLSYPLTLLHSLIFGSLISAVDPVATLAIFNSLKVDAILHTLVFGESVLNDAVSIVLTKYAPCLVLYTISGPCHSHHMCTLPSVFN